MKHVIASLVAMVALLLAGCSTAAQDLPLPGSRVSGPSYQISAQFPDALNLAEGAAVKVNGLQVGRVRDISVKNFTAHVVMDIEKSRTLSREATARLRSTTPLGELFVQIDEPQKATGQNLKNGDVLGTDSTSVAPTIEDTMSTASLLINGGGLGQIETIVEEANHLLGGREGIAKDTLHKLNTALATVNASDTEISAALKALSKVATVLDERQEVIDAALRDVRPAAKVLSDNTASLVELLQSLDKLSADVVTVLNESQDSFKAMAKQMGPIFAELNSIQKQFRPGMQTVISFAKLIDRAVPAEYLNTYLYFQTQVTVGLPNLPIIGDLGLPSIDTPDLGSLVPSPGTSSTSEPSKPAVPGEGLLPGGQGTSGESSPLTNPLSLLGLDRLFGGHG